MRSRLSGETIARAVLDPDLQASLSEIREQLEEARDRVATTPAPTGAQELLITMVFDMNMMEERV